MCHYIVTSLEDKVGTIIPNDPEERNALSKAMTSGLCQALESCQFDPDVRVVVLRGVGGCFNAGGDITSMKKRVDCYARGLRSEAQTKENMAGFNHLILAIHQIEKPVVSWIEGAYVGGSLSIAVASNFSTADESCKMTSAFVDVGLASNMGSSLMLVRRVGSVGTIDLFVIGRRFTSGEAARLDIVTQAVPASDLEQTVDALTAKLATGPVVSCREIKGAVNRILYPDLYQCMAMESDCVDRLTHTADHAETVYTFLEKRALRLSRT